MGWFFYFISGYLRSNNIYNWLGFGEKISSDLLDCPKCGRRTKAGKQVDFDKKWNSPAAKARQKGEAANTNFQLLFIPIALVAIIGGCVAVFQDVTKERPKSAEDIKIDRLRFCEDLIKENLKDPVAINVSQVKWKIRTGIIRYSGTIILKAEYNNHLNFLIIKTWNATKFSYNCGHTPRSFKYRVII